MKSLKQIIQENYKFKINRNSKAYEYSFFPTTWDELNDILNQKWIEFREGTEDNPVDMNDIDVSKIDDMTQLFEDSNFEYIDISYWDVSNVKNMNSMFCDSSLISIGDISNWDVSKVENMGYMFFRTQNLSNIGNINGWNVDKLIKMNKMFEQSSIYPTPIWYKNK